jgi:hypothetical protein
MRQETNNEMDLLLRRLGRQQDVFAPHAGDHLDADELSAYAENALPAKSRTRYTEHLADCSRCRELVVQLSAAAGVAITEQTTKVLEPSGLKKLLASLFSPMVLRYAAPALGLIVVAVIGFVVLRRERPTEFVSQKQNGQARPAAVAEPTDVGKDDGRITYGLSKPSDAAVNKEAQSRNPSAPSPTPVPQGNTQTAVEENAPAAKAPAEKPESQPVVAAAPPAAGKLDSLTDEKRQKNEDSGRKQEAEVKVAQSEVTQKDFEADRAENKKAAEPAATRSRPAKSKSVVGDLSSAQGAGAPATQQREGVERDDKDSETRSVAGRRFRKQRGVWIDTAYDPSREIMILTRGSENYRVLVADEPAIKTIADQLDGEIIVVWKGRTYRIR